MHRLHPSAISILSRWNRPAAVVLMLTLLLIPQAARAAAVSISATVDKTHLSLADTLELSVRINGTQRAPAPELPPLPEFKLESRGTATSLQVINGVRHAAVTYRYLLTPLKAGTFEIGAIRLELDGQPYETPPIQVTVATAASFPDGEAPVFAEAVISNPEPYVQEQAVVSYRLYRKVEAANLDLEAPAGHFRKAPLGEVREYSRVINGVRYYVHEKSFALFPMREGRLEIPPATIHLDLVHRDSRQPGPFDGFNLPHPLDPLFNDPFLSGPVRLERKNLHTQPLEVHVKPLPAEGQPPGFSNLVGQFEIHSSLSKTDLEAGDTTTWTVTVSGRGNVGLALVEPPEETPGLKVYRDQPEIEETPHSDFLEGSKTFRFALVPTRPGTLSLPQLTLHFFDPERGRYRRLTTPLQTLKVRTGGGASVSTNTAAPLAPAASGGSPDSALLPIHTQLNLFEPPGKARGAGVFWVSGFLLPPLLYWAGRTAYVRRQRLKYDVGFARRRQALQRAETRLAQLAIDEPREDRDTAREVSRLLRDYVGDKLNLQGAACTPDEVESKLREGRYNEAAVRAARALLDRCEAVEYAAVPHDGPEDWVETTRRLLRELEKQS